MNYLKLVPRENILFSNLQKRILSFNYLLSGFDIPQCTAHVTGTGDYLIVVQETTARQISCVSGQFSTDAHVAFPRLEAVYRTDIVEASAGHVTAWRGVRAGHHPRRPQGNCVNLVQTRRKFFKRCWGNRNWNFLFSELLYVLQV